MIKPRIGTYVVYEPDEEGWQEFDEQFSQFKQDLGLAGLEAVPAPEPVIDLPSSERVAAFLSSQSIDVLHPLIITWSFDHYTIEIQQKVRRPVLIRSIPGIRSGSLVGGEQLNCALEDIEIPHWLIYGELSNPAITQETADYARAVAIQNRLYGARIAVIGRRTEGMTPTAVDELEILRLFGIRLLNFGMDEFDLRASAISEKEALAAWYPVKQSANKVMSTRDQVLPSFRNYLALTRMIEEYGLAAVSVGSYPKCQGTMCLPIALLNENGYPTGCEGDVNSTIAMFILSMLSESPVHFGEMLEVDEENNTLVTSHCGCGSPSLADENGFVLCPVRLADDGVCIRYSARPGEVTFTNLVGRKDNYRMCAFSGEALPTQMVFEGNPLKFRMKTPFRRIWQDVNKCGLGHHWMTAYGNFVPVLDHFCQLSGVKGVFPDER